ncbi:hypothetical protein Ndes2526B_g05865 [Nannochloris sp. 'desiccata']
MDGAPTCRVLRLRGLPYTANKDAIVEFFEGFSVLQVYLLQRNGKPTGEAYAEFSSAEIATQAMEARQRAHLGTRYIEIFHAKEASLVASTIESSDREPSLAGFVVRLRGLPFNSTSEDILNFFDPVISMGASSGVLFSCAQDGRFTGDAFIEVKTEEDLEICLQKNKEFLGSRYIETTRSTKGELFHIAYHRGFFTLVAGVKKYYSLNPNSIIHNTINQHSGEVDSAGNAPRIRTSNLPHRGDHNLNQAFTGLGFSHSRAYLPRQHMQQHYHAGAAGTFTQLNYPIGAMSQQPVMQIGISQHHSPPGWTAVSTNRAGPPTPSGAFSPPATGPGQQQQRPHWGNRRQSTGSCANTPPQAQQQSMPMTPFVVHPFMTAAAPQSATWGSPATATYVRMPQRHQQQQIQQQQAASATAWYGGTNVIILAGSGGAMSRQYPGFQGHTTDGRRHYPMHQQHQDSHQLTPRSKSHRYQQQYPQRIRGGADSSSTFSGGQLAQPAPNTTTTASSSISVATLAPPKLDQTPINIPFYGNEKIIFGQGIPSQSSSAESAKSDGEKDGSSDARSPSPPT